MPNIPNSFSSRACEGTAAEKRLRQLGTVSVPFMAIGSEEDGRKACDDLHETDGTLAFVDQSSEPLMPSLVRSARLDEMTYFREMQVYDKVSVAECTKATGRNPIGVRWVDTHKGDSTQPNDRSRLVA